MTEYEAQALARLGEIVESAQSAVQLSAVAAFSAACCFAAVVVRLCILGKNQRHLMSAPFILLAIGGQAQAIQGPTGTAGPYSYNITWFETGLPGEQMGLNVVCTWSAGGGTTTSTSSTATVDYNYNTFTYYVGSCSGPSPDMPVCLRNKIYNVLAPYPRHQITFDDPVAAAQLGANAGNRPGTGYTSPGARTPECSSDPCNLDTDGDGVTDCSDADIDNDGICNVCDVCPYGTSWQDANGVWQVCSENGPDQDTDGWVGAVDPDDTDPLVGCTGCGAVDLVHPCESCDPCEDFANTGTEYRDCLAALDDADGDGAYDSCDPDDTDPEVGCEEPTDPDFETCEQCDVCADLRGGGPDSTAYLECLDDNSLRTDDDGDGSPNSVDPEPNNASVGCNCEIREDDCDDDGAADDDDDGICNACDRCKDDPEQECYTSGEVDEDGDGYPVGIDLDDNDSGITCQCPEACTKEIECDCVPDLEPLYSAAAEMVSSLPLPSRLYEFPTGSTLTIHIPIKNPLTGTYWVAPERTTWTIDSTFAAVDDWRDTIETMRVGIRAAISWVVAIWGCWKCLHWLM